MKTKTLNPILISMNYLLANRNTFDLKLTISMLEQIENILRSKARS